MVTHRSLAFVSLAAALLAGPVIAQTAATGAIDGPSQLSNTAFSADNAPVVDASGGWREGRATFYDAPDYFQQVRMYSAGLWTSYTLLDHPANRSFLGGNAGLCIERSRCFWRHQLW